MKQYVGLNVSVKETVICVVGEDGQICRMLQADAEYKVAPDQTFEAHGTPLPRGSHTYTVRATMARAPAVMVFQGFEFLRRGKAA